MKKFIVIALSCSLSSSLLAQTIAVINMKEIMEKAPQAQAAGQRLEKAVKPRQEKFEAQLKKYDKKDKEFNRDKDTYKADVREKAEKELASLKESITQEEIDFQQDITDLQKAENEHFQEILTKAVAEYAKANKIDAVEFAQNFIYVDPDINITSKILDSMKKLPNTAPKKVTPGTSTR